MLSSMLGIGYGDGCAATCGGLACGGMSLALGIDSRFGISGGEMPVLPLG
jgi:hypothetical protein